MFEENKTKIKNFGIKFYLVTAVTIELAKCIFML